MIHADFCTATWHTSSYSGDSGNCVEIAHSDPAIDVRDSKRRDAGTLTFSRATWCDLLAHLHEM